MNIEHQGKEIVFISPGSPMGSELLGKSVGDAIKIEAGTSRTEY